MSVKELEEQVSQLPPEQLSEFDSWWETHRSELLHEQHGETDAVKAELHSRKQEYFDHPERFIHIESDEDLEKFFEDIQRDVAAKISSARQG